MPQYCDTNNLENNWYNWILSSRTPELNKFRNSGILWTRPKLYVADTLGKNVSKKKFLDPNCEVFKHCILVDEPIYFESEKGQFDKSVLETAITPPFASDKLQKDGYILEIDEKQSWDNMTMEMFKICQGVSTKFSKIEEEQIELANEAFMQVLSKIRRNKLTYTPGRAPVFNLLTTTAFRILYSHMNKRKTQKNNIMKIIIDAKNGNLPQNQRSFKHNMQPNKLNHKPV